MAKVRLTTAQKIEQTRAKLQALEAREIATKRKADNRQKIVIGGTVLAEMRESPAFQTQIVGILQTRITRPLDREAVSEWLSTVSPQE